MADDETPEPPTAPPAGQPESTKPAPPPAAPDPQLIGYVEKGADSDTTKRGSDDE
jgi:hypothetical protein